MFVKFSITCCSTGEAKPAAASSHAVRVMGPEVLDSGGGQPGQQERGVEGAGGGRESSLCSLRNLPLLMSRDQFTETVTETHCTNSPRNQLRQI